MPPIIEDYADIKRRMDALEGRPDGRDTVDEVLARIEGNLRRFKESMAAQQSGSGGQGGGGSIWSFTVGSGGGGGGGGAAELFIPARGAQLDILSDAGHAFMRKHGGRPVSETE